MNTPTFFVKNVTYNLPRNQSQKVAIDAVLKMQYRTIESPQELDEFEHHLQDILDDAHDSSPKCRPMEVSKSIGTDGVRTFFLQVAKSCDSSFCIIEVCYIRGAWKEARHG